MQIDRKTFYEIQPKIANVVFDQTEEWMNFKNTNNIEFVFFADDIANPSICCWGRVFKKRIIGNILEICGESIRECISTKQMIKFYSSLISKKYSMILINSLGKYDVNFEIAMRRSGFNRPLGNMLCPLTILIDFTKERKTARNWKRNVKKAESLNLIFNEIIHPTIEDVKKFSEMFDELAIKKDLSFRLDYIKIAELLKSDRFKLFFVYKDNKPVCGRIIYVDGEKSADVFAANSNEARTCGATYLIMEQIFNYLNEKGIKEFDFSRIPPSNNETDSVYVYKNYSGGDPIQYNGEWFWGKNKYITLFFSIYKFYIKSAHHY